MLIHRIPADPFRTMDLLFGSRMPAGRRAAASRSKPNLFALDEHEDRFELRAELPGLTPDELELSVADGWLEIEAKRELEVPEGYQVLRHERVPYGFARRLELPKRVDAGKAEATLRDGVLTVTLPKHATVTPRQIAIKAA